VIAVEGLVFSKGIGKSYIKIATGEIPLNSRACGDARTDPPVVVRPVRELDDRARQLVDVLLEAVADAERAQGRREVVDRLVELVPEGEVGDGGGQGIHGLIEVPAEGQVREVGREVVDWEVEHSAEGQRNKGLGEMVDRLIEVVSKGDVC